MCVFLHRSVPDDPEKKKLWVAAIETYQQFDFYASKYFVCEQHFLVSEVKRNGFRTTLLPSAVPTVYPNLYVRQIVLVFFILIMSNNVLRYFSTMNF